MTIEENKKKLSQKVANSMAEMAEMIKNASEKIKGNRLNEMIDLIVKAHGTSKGIFIMGVGRSGLVGQAFAMRLVHLGFNAYVIGEPTTRAITPQDIVVVISGSGTTGTNLTLCQAIRKKIEPNPKIIAITSYPSSPLGGLADITIEIPGREEAEAIKDYEERRLTLEPPLAPLGTRFEINTLVFLDSVIPVLMELIGISEVEMAKKHAIE